MFVGMNTCWVIVARADAPDVSADAIEAPHAVAMVCLACDRPVLVTERRVTRGGRPVEVARAFECPHCRALLGELDAPRMQPLRAPDPQARARLEQAAQRAEEEAEKWRDRVFHGRMNRDEALIREAQGWVLEAEARAARCRRELDALT